MNKYVGRAMMISGVGLSALLGGCVTLTTNNYYGQDDPARKASVADNGARRECDCDACEQDRKRRYGYYDPSYEGRPRYGNYPQPTPPLVHSPSIYDDYPYWYYPYGYPPRVIYTPRDHSPNESRATGGTNSDRSSGATTTEGAQPTTARPRRDAPAQETPVDGRDRVDYPGSRPIVITAPAPNDEAPQTTETSNDVLTNAPVTAAGHRTTVPGQDEGGQGGVMTGPQRPQGGETVGSRPTSELPESRPQSGRPRNSEPTSTTGNAPITAPATASMPRRVVTPESPADARSRREPVGGASTTAAAAGTEQKVTAPSILAPSVPVTSQPRREMPVTSDPVRTSGAAESGVTVSGKSSHDVPIAPVRQAEAVEARTRRDVETSVRQVATPVRPQVQAPREAGIVESRQRRSVTPVENVVKTTTQEAAANARAIESASVPVTPAQPAKEPAAASVETVTAPAAEPATARVVRETPR